MKKLLSLLLTGMMMLTVLTACGSKTVTIDVNEAATALCNNLTYVGTMQEVASKQLETTYDGIQMDSIVASKVYMDGFTAEEVAVFEMTDDAAATSLKTVLETYVSARKDLFASYAPEGAARLDKAVIKQAGEYVILCVSNDTEKVASAVDGVLK